MHHLCIGFVGLFYPETLGLGYDFIQGMTSSRAYQASLAKLIAILILKIVLTSLTLNFGGSGGLFIPSLYVGGTLGLIYAQLWGFKPATPYVMISMAATLAATSKSLLTSIALVAETLGSSSIIPTVISTTISYFLTGNKSFYRKHLINRSIK